jgi:hypothetical protein
VANSGVACSIESSYISVQLGNLLKIFLAESEIVGLEILCIATFIYRSRPRAFTSSTSENISNSILIYGLQFSKKIELDSLLREDFIHGPFAELDSYICRVKVG